MTMLMASTIFLDENVEILSDEEKTARNTFIVAKVALENSRQHIDAWKQTQFVDLEFYDILKKDITDSLK